MTQETNFQLNGIRDFGFRLARSRHDVFGGKSQEFLREHVEKNPDKPFFLYHATQAVHVPSFPGQDFKGKTSSGPHGDFIFEFVTAADLINAKVPNKAAEDSFSLVPSVT